MSVVLNPSTRIERIYHKHKGVYGRLRITQSMRNAGIMINHKKVYRIMRKLGLKAVIRRKWCTRKYIKENVADNILNRLFKANEPLKKLVCDVTELKRVNDKRYFLFSIMDLYNNAVIASNVSSRNDLALVMKGLWKLSGQIEGTILHSDQGSQFTSIAYRKYCEQNKITLSMSRVGKRRQGKFFWTLQRRVLYILQSCNTTGVISEYNRLHPLL